jgi:putative tricarboxylic transport membrane protein
VSTVIIAALATPLTKMALLFGPADYFSLMVLGLMFAVVLARGSVAKAIAVILVGILLSTVGTDLESGEERLTFGWSEISDGLDVAVLAMGLFGSADCCPTAKTSSNRPCRSRAAHCWARCWDCFPATVRS